MLRLPGTVLLLVAVPPLQTPDGRTFQANGAPADPALVAAMQPFGVLIHHPQRWAADVMWQPPFAWSPGRVQTQVVTARCPPMLYVAWTPVGARWCRACRGAITGR